MNYCTYITFYKGNKLPPFYIGFSTIKRIANGYHGSVSSKQFARIWREELRENPQLFKTVVLTRHELMNEAKSRETELQTALNVARNQLYVNAHVHGMKFCCDRTGILHSQATIQKLKKSRQGKTPVKPGSKISQQHREKISLALRGRKPSPETIAKRSQTRTGKKNTKQFSDVTRLRISEALKIRMAKHTKEELSEMMTGANNPFFGKKHTEEMKAHLRSIDRSYLKKLLWWTNGYEVVRAECSPGLGWSRGRKLGLKSEN